MPTVSFIVIHLTVPWEDSTDKAEKRKKLSYASLAAETETGGTVLKCEGVQRELAGTLLVVPQQGF